MWGNGAAIRLRIEGEKKKKKAKAPTGTSRDLRREGTAYHENTKPGTQLLSSQERKLAPNKRESWPEISARPKETSEQESEKVERSNLESGR